MLAMAFHEFTCTDLVAPFWTRRFAQLDAGDELAPATLAPLSVAERRLASRRPSSRGRAGAAGAERRGASTRRTASSSGRSATASSTPAPWRRPRACTATRSPARRGAGTASRSAGSRRCARRRRCGWVRCAAPRPRRGWRWSLRARQRRARRCVVRVASARCAARARRRRGGRGARRPRSRPPPAPHRRSPSRCCAPRCAHFHLARGEPDAALREARAAGRLVSATISNPYCCDRRSAAALALAALGRAEEARAAAEDELADARRFGVAEAEGASLRTLGLVVRGAAGVQALQRRRRRARARREAASSTPARCSSSERRCAARVSGSAAAAMNAQPSLATLDYLIARRRRGRLGPDGVGACRHARHGGRLTIRTRRLRPGDRRTTDSSTSLHDNAGLIGPGGLDVPPDVGTPWST